MANVCDGADAEAAAEDIDKDVTSGSWSRLDGKLQGYLVLPADIEARVCTEHGPGRRTLMLHQDVST